MASVQVEGEAIHSGQGAENREGAGRGGCSAVFPQGGLHLLRLLYVLKQCY